MRRKRWIKASLLTMIAAAPVVGVLTDIVPAVAAQDPASVQALVDTITNDNSTSPQREEAAVQLIGRGSPDADNSVDMILRSGNEKGEIAIARALAKASSLNPRFIPSLGERLGASHDLTVAAAAALANCDGQPGVFDALRTYADNLAASNADRAIAIRALGSVVQEKVASYLIDLLNAPGQNAVIVNAAMDALAELTGITSNGSDPLQWQKWWNTARTKNADQFRSAVLVTRDLRAKLQRQHQVQVDAAMSQDLKNNYTDLKGFSRNTSEAVLVGYLNNRVAEIRAVGVDIVEFNEFDKIVVDARVRDRLLKMIDDPDDSLRLKVVGVMLDLKEQAALPLMINRLAVEKSLPVKAKLAQALGKLAEIQAAPALITLLDDPQPDVVIAGAKALAGDLGKNLHDHDPSQAEKAANKLRTIFDKNDNQPGTADLCAACLSALAALKDKLALDIFRTHVVPAQPVEVRRAALQGLGSLGDERADQTVADQLGDNDATVRLEAARALQAVATPVELDLIVRRMKEDPDSSVRDALWIALSKKLYPKLKPDDLSRIAADLNDDPNHTKDPDKTRRLFTLAKLNESYAANNDLQAVALNRQVIADAMMTLNPPHVQDAIDTLKLALDYWKSKGDRDKLESLIDQLLDAELKAKQWDVATRFAADQIKFDPVYQQTVGPKIRGKIDDMINGEHPDLDAAKSLIDNALKMDPKLETRYFNQVQSLQDQLKAKAAAPPG